MAHSNTAWDPSMPRGTNENNILVMKKSHMNGMILKLNYERVVKTTGKKSLREQIIILRVWSWTIRTGSKQQERRP